MTDTVKKVYYVSKFKLVNFKIRLICQTFFAENKLLKLRNVKYK